jgi:hypothetical protein
MNNLSPPGAPVSHGHQPHARRLLGKVDGCTRDATTRWCHKEARGPQPPSCLFQLPLRIQRRGLPQRGKCKAAKEKLPILPTTVHLSLSLHKFHNDQVPHMARPTRPYPETRGPLGLWSPDRCLITALTRLEAAFISFSSLLKKFEAL